MHSQDHFFLNSHRNCIYVSGQAGLQHGHYEYLAPQTLNDFASLETETHVRNQNGHLKEIKRENRAFSI